MHARILRQLLVALSLACPGAAVAQAPFTITPSWDGIKACAGTPITGPSPAFQIANAPAGTAELEFIMTDLDAPNFRHGGGKVRYAGEPQIAPGAFQFIGPCPPSTHRYEWTVTARNAAGQQLGVAKATRNYP